MSLRRRCTEVEPEVEWGHSSHSTGSGKKLKTVIFENIGWEKGEVGPEGGNARGEAVE